MAETSADLGAELEHRWYLISLGLNHPIIDSIVEKCSSRWKELARLLPDRCSPNWREESRYFTEPKIDNIVSRLDLRSNEELCRKALTDWLLASRAHGLRELLHALRKAELGQCADLVERELLSASVAGPTGEQAAHRGASDLRVVQDVHDGCLNIPHEEIQVSDVTLAEQNGLLVQKALWRGHPVAIKTHRTQSVQDFQKLQAEFAILCKLHHPKVVRTYGIYAPSTPHTGIVMELADMSLSLRCHGKHQPALQCAEIVVVLVDVADALAYLHARRIIHRDLSSSNILLFVCGYTQQVAKITDFGSAKALGFVESPSEFKERSKGVGTQGYIAPERFLQPGQERPIYNNLVDVYALGVVGVEVHVRAVPNQANMSGWLDQLLQKGCPPALLHILRQCVHPDPLNRPDSTRLTTLLEDFRSSQRHVCGSMAVQSAAIQHAQLARHASLQGNAEIPMQDEDALGTEQPEKMDALQRENEELREMCTKAEVAAETHAEMVQCFQQNEVELTARLQFLTQELNHQAQRRVESPPFTDDDSHVVITKESSPTAAHAGSLAVFGQSCGQRRPPMAAQSAVGSLTAPAAFQLAKAEDRRCPICSLELPWDLPMEDVTVHVNNCLK